MPLLVARDGGTVSANHAALRLFGVGDLAALQDRERAQLHMPPHDVQRVRALLDALARGADDAATTSCRILRPDGSHRTVEWTTIHAEFDDGPAWVHAIADITDLVSTRDQLAASEARHRNIIDALAAGVVVVDTEGRCTAWNPAAVAILRLQSPDLLLHAPASALTLLDEDGTPIGEDRHPVWRALRGANVQRELFGVAFRHYTHHLRISAQPLLTQGADAPIGAVLTFTDVTRERRAAAALARSERRLRELADMSPVAIFECDAHGRQVWANPKWEELAGITAGEGQDDGWTEAIHPDDLEHVHRSWAAAQATESEFSMEMRYFGPHSDRVVSAHVRARPIHRRDGSLRGWLGTATDLTEEHHLRHELAESEARFRALSEQSPDVIIRVRLRPHSYEYVSPAITTLTGWLTPDLLYRHPEALEEAVHPEDRERLAAAMGATHDEPDAGRFRIVRADGKVRHVEPRTVVLTDEHGTPTHLEATIRDVTDSVLAQEYLEALAHRDALTGLLNRRALSLCLERRFEDDQPTALLFCDLDGFKQVNDLLGHDAGDQVLVTVARRLEQSVRAEDLVARYAGDEFVVVCQPQLARIVAERLLATFDAPIELDGGRYAHVGVSIGIAQRDPSPATRTSPETLLRRADEAMYRAKRAGASHIEEAPDDTGTGPPQALPGEVTPVS